MNDERKSKVLISAYACEPHKGSEPGVGWNWAKQIAKFAEVWVITRANNRDAIEEELKKSPISNLHFLYYDLPKWARFWKRGRRGYRLYYYFWQIFAYFTARTCHKKIKFDICHHITFSPCFYPSFLSLLPLPFVWGPLGGVEKYPKKFWSFFPILAIVKEILRDFYIRLAFLLDPFLKLTIKKSSLILVCDEDTEIFLKKKYFRKPIRKFSQIGIFPNLEQSAIKNWEMITLLTVGRLVPKKGTYIIMRAFIETAKKYSNFRLIVASDGPEQNRLKKLVYEAKMIDRIEFTGNVDLKRLTQLYHSADIFLMGSLQDSGGLVVLEAMAAGLPVICFKLGGPGEIVTEKCGIAVEAIDVQQSIKDFSKAIEILIVDDMLRRELATGAKERIFNIFHWDKKGEFIRKIYEEVLSNEDYSHP
jgi:glycosyltransferase involved in cell wall biosynthesis